ncbi:hypothetical protein PQR70_25575 [Paraburkholderia madseniana]|uniref:hypothetical protein n=1 Tax=Paraburkholderia madseniana TaxID=2599607 RepID=UPI0038BD86C7
MLIDNEMSKVGFGVSTSRLKLSEFHHFLRVRHERTRCEKYRHFVLRAMGERLRTGCRPVTGTGRAQRGGRPTIETEE